MNAAWEEEEGEEVVEVTQVFCLKTLKEVASLVVQEVKPHHWELLSEVKQEDRKNLMSQFGILWLE